MGALAVRTTYKDMVPQIRAAVAEAIAEERVALIQMAREAIAIAANGDERAKFRGLECLLKKVEKRDRRC